MISQPVATLAAAALGGLLMFVLSRRRDHAVRLWERQIELYDEVFREARELQHRAGTRVASGGVDYWIDRIEPCDADGGIRAYGYPAALVLRLLHRHEFRFLYTVDSPP